MAETKHIKGILFDSGDTLVFPRSGSWWPGPDFESILLQYGIDISRITPDTMSTALAEGERYLNDNHMVVNIEEEMDQFRTYYRMICHQAGIIDADSALIEDLASAYVKKCNFTLYPDTIPTLEQLKVGGIMLGIISDAWPSLNDKYISLGIRDFFKSFTLSAETGCCKPNELIYQKAIKEIGIDRENLLFVDNDIDNVKAAIRLGMSGLVLLRNGETLTDDVSFVRKLPDILDFVF